MAGLTMTKVGGFNDSIFGKSAEPISMVMEKDIEAFEQRSALKNIFDMKKSKNFAEKMTALSAMDDFEPVGENGGHPTSEFSEVFNKVIEHETFKKGFNISREMVDDAKFNLMKDRAIKFTQAYGRSRERFGAAALAGGLTGSFTFGGKTFDATCADGKALFSKSHPYFFKPTKNQSNLFAGSFSAANLGKLATAMQNFEGDKGEILALAPDTIIIPNDAGLKYDVFEAIGADKDPDTSNNGFNYQYGMWNVIVWPYLNQFMDLTTDKPWILFDSHFNKTNGTAIWYDRVPLEVKAFVDNENDSARYNGYARWSAGFNNWRGIAIGGVTGGTTL